MEDCHQRCEALAEMVREDAFYSTESCEIILVDMPLVVSNLECPRWSLHRRSPLRPQMTRRRRGFADIVSRP